MNERKPAGFWIREECFKAALNCGSRSEFKRRYSHAWDLCRKNGWLDEACKHMVPTTVVHGYWQQYENCFNAARQCITPSQFERQFPQAYKVATKNNWKKDYTWFESGAKIDGKRRTKWTFDSCAAESTKYHTISEFQQGSKGAYKKAWQNGWIESFTWLHRGANIYGASDCVYKYEFRDHHAVYVGRTIRKRERNYEHIFNTNNDPVARFAQEHGIDVPEMEVLADDLTISEGQELEDVWRSYYAEQGYLVLNKAKTGKNIGSIGSIGSGKWNYDSCYQEAKRYKTRKEFQVGNVSAYTRALQYKWLDDYYWFDAAKTGRIKWTEQRCYEEAQKYLYVEDFRGLSLVAYNKAKKQNWLNDYIWLTKKPKTRKTPDSVLFWTKDRCFVEAKKYKSRTEFQYAKGASSAYKIALRNGWIDDYDWMTPKAKPSGYWDDYDRCYEEAKKYKTRTEFQYAKGASRAYKASVKNGWIDDYTWMPPKKKPSGYWTRERCREEALKYTSRAEFKKNSGSAYTISLRNGWYNDYDWLE